MADQILNAIIELENRIALQLQQERQRADAWLAMAHQQLKAEACRQQQQLDADNQRLILQAEEQIDKDCARLLKTEMAYCRRLEELSDQALSEVLNRQLNRILPRPVDDHQNGES